MPEGGNEGGGRRPAAHRLYALVAWPTLGGLPLVDEARAPTLERELIALCRRLGTEPLEVRVRRDRVVLLLRVAPGQALAEVVRRLKRASGLALRRWGWCARWGRGFAACTVGPGQVHRLVRRIRAERRVGTTATAASTAVGPGRPARRSRRRVGG